LLNLLPWRWLLLQRRRVTMIRFFRKPIARAIQRGLLAGICMIGAAQAYAQLPDVTASEHPGSQTPTESAPTLFPHIAAGRFWLSGQANFIFQANPRFSAQYSGKNSFRSHYNKSLGRVVTLYGGMQLGRTTEVLVDGEGRDDEDTRVESAIRDSVAGDVGRRRTSGARLGAACYVARSGQDTFCGELWRRTRGCVFARELREKDRQDGPIPGRAIGRWRGCGGERHSKDMGARVYLDQCAHA
jgi:hypothetical protein